MLTWRSTCSKGIALGNSLEVLWSHHKSLLTLLKVNAREDFLKVEKRLSEILEPYHSRVDAEPSASAKVCETKENYSKYAGFLTSGELLQIVGRGLEEQYVDQFSVTDLERLEKQLEATLIRTRSTKENLLQEKNRLLREKAGGNEMDESTNRMIMDLSVLSHTPMLDEQQHVLFNLL